VSTTKPTRKPKRFDELRKPIQSDPARSARVEEHKAAMLGELRRKLDLTQAVVADRLDVTQENVSQIERGEADVRLSTLSRYVEALGGRLEIRATFPEETVALTLGKAATLRRQKIKRARQVPNVNVSS
jgi:DNA-binding XRE family transcriptional regulator